MSKVKAGVVLVTKFVRPGSKAFKGYINYIDREEAVRNEYTDEWNGYVDIWEILRRHQRYLLRLRIN